MEMSEGNATLVIVRTLVGEKVHSISFAEVLSQLSLYCSCCISSSSSAFWLAAAFPCIVRRFVVPQTRGFGAGLGHDSFYADTCSS